MKNIIYENYAIMEAVNSKVDDVLQVGMDKFNDMMATALSTIIDVVAIGVVGYMIYQIIKVMWFQKPEDSQKAVFSYFCLMLLRILSTVLKIQLGA